MAGAGGQLKYLHPHSSTTLAADKHLLQPLVTWNVPTPWTTLHCYNLINALRKPTRPKLVEETKIKSVNQEKFFNILTYRLSHRFEVTMRTKQQVIANCHINCG